MDSPSGRRLRVVSLQAASMDSGASLRRSLAVLGPSIPVRIHRGSKG